MTRFIILPSDAAELVLKVGQLAMPGEIFVLKMKAVRIRDLAEASLDFYSRMYGRDPKAMASAIIGGRPGEKIHEELMTRNEAENSMAEEDFYIVNPNPKRFAQSQRRVGISGGYVSDSVPLIGKEEIARMLSRLHIHGT